MSDKRYQAGIIAGIASSRTPGDWPDAIEGLGPKNGGQPFARCAECPPHRHPVHAGTHVRYGGLPLCKLHANALAKVA